MKTGFTLILNLLLILLISCSAQEANPSSSDIDTGTSQNNNPQPTESVQQLIPEVSTTLPDAPVTLPPDPNNVPPASQPSSVSTITFEDNGKTFIYRVGDSFLLNLGDDVYEWTVTVDNQDVVALQVGMMVIKGAQGLFGALSPGTATLAAVGDPLCRKADPPCGMPTILFKVNLVVE